MLVISGSFLLSGNPSFCPFLCQENLSQVKWVIHTEKCYSPYQKNSFLAELCT